ncbi:hypothetical protein EV426DRAFT_436543 [Tirmania nivea]|nr:hypothetical protein EV426DRAFT_436543 [Tirmania nivea]
MAKDAYVLIGACYLQMVILFTVSIYKTVVAAHAHQHIGCTEIAGNQDMYGLGIRVGLYLQLCVTSLVDTMGNKELSASLIPANFWFLFALIIALGTMLTDPAIYAAEIYVIISLGNGIMQMIVGKSVKETSTFEFSDGFIVSLSRILLSGLWRALSSVYWFSAMDKAAKGSCESYGWFFFKVDLYGKFRTFNNVTNVMVMIMAAAALYQHSRIMVVFSWFLWRKVNRENWGERRESKWMVAIDYLFVPMGVLATMIDGEPKETEAQPRHSTALPATQGAVQDNLPNNPTASPAAQVGVEEKSARDMRILAHLRQHYGDDNSTMQQQDPSQGVDGNSGVANLGAAMMGTATGPQGTPLPIMDRASHTNSIFDPFKTHKLPLMILWDVSNILFAVLNVEYALVFNNVIDVYEMKSAGQFVALVIGVGGVLTAMSELYVDLRTKRIKKAHSTQSVMIWPTVMVTRMLKMNQLKSVEVIPTRSRRSGGVSGSSRGQV